MKARNAALVMSAFALAACSGQTHTEPSGYTVEDNPQPVLSPTAIAAPALAWTWVDVPQSFCGNGNTTGFAVNLASDSNELVIVYEGGGACYDAFTCYGVASATHLATGYDHATFDSEQPLLAQYLLLNRQDPNNPFAHANIAYVPYCTGDVHDGNQVVRYDNANQTTHHVGFRNGQVFTQLLAATLPQVQHVWVAGFSAGGFGAVFHFEDTQAQFPGATVDVIDDSGSSFPGFDGHPSWNAQLPANCPTCSQDDFTSLVKAFSAANPNSRFGMLSYSADTTLPLFFGITEAQFSADLQQYEALMDTLPNVKYFVPTGKGHVLLLDDALSAGNQTITTWVQQMVGEDPSWQSKK